MCEEVIDHCSYTQFIQKNKQLCTVKLSLKKIQGEQDLNP